MYKLFYDRTSKIYLWDEEPTDGYSTPIKAVIAELQRNPQRVGLIKCFMVINRMPYDAILTAALTYFTYHPWSKKYNYVYRRDGLLNLYSLDGTHCAIIKTNGDLIKWD
jgi:hypothetical protein